MAIHGHPERGTADVKSKGALPLAALFALLSSAQLASASPAPIVQPGVGGSTWTADRTAKLASDLDTMLASDPALRGAHYGVYAIDTTTGKPLYSRNLDDEIQPASTLKLVVGSAALEKLNADFHFQTSAYASNDGSFVAVITGGDPTLLAADLQDAARAYVRQHTVRTVHVAAAYDLDPPYPNGWTWDDFGQDYAPMISTSTINENVVAVKIHPAATVGDRASATTDDAAVFGRVNPICDSRTSSPPIILTDVRTGSATSDDTVDVVMTGDGCPKIVGSIPLGAADETIGVSVTPTKYLRASFVKALNDAGVTVADAVGPPAVAGQLLIHPESRGPGPFTASLPERTPDIFWQHKSEPLSMLLGPRFWIPSDNLFGELLLRQLGETWSTESGIAYEKTWLQSIGIDPATVTLADGCGMSQYDRITPRDLVTILQHDWNGPNRQLVLDSLPVGGARGTIEGIAGTDAAGRVFAKTGSMMHVRGLAGYLATLHHGPVTFAFEVDDWNGAYPALAALRTRVLSRIIDD